MADLDTLQIEITADIDRADKAISKLQSALATLNSSFHNYHDASEYVKGIANLTAGLNSFSEALDSIDTYKITEIAKAIGTLASNGGKLSGLTVGKMMAEMGAQAQTASAKASKAAKDIAQTFGFAGKKGVSELTEAIQRFYNAGSDTEKLNAAQSDIKAVIDKYAQFGTVVDETYDKVRKYLKGQTMYLPKGTLSEFGDNARSVRGTLGIGATTTDMTKGSDIQAIVSEMNELYGTTLDVSGAYQDTARALYDYLENGKKLQEDFNQESLKSRDYLMQVADAINQLYDSVEKTQDAVKDNGLIGNAASENPTLFGDMVTGLETLQNINIGEEQFAGLVTLTGSIGKLGGVYAGSATQTLPLIADGLERLSGVTVNPGLGEQLTALGTGMASLGKASVQRAANLPFIADGLRQLIAIGPIPKLEGLEELAKSLAVFGRSTAQNAVTTIPQLAVAFRQLIETLATAPNVSRSTIDLANAMATLVSNCRGVGGASSSASRGLNLFSKSAKKAHRHTHSLAAMFGKLYASYFLVIRAAKAFGRAISYASDLREVQNVVSTTFGSATKDVQTFADSAIMSFGMSELSAKQFASRFQAMGVAMGVTSKQVSDASDFIASKTEGNKRAYTDLGDSMADVSINLTKLTADMASFYNKDYEEVAEDMASIFTGMTRPLRKYGADLTEATLKEWALSNGLDGNIKKMTQAEKTMLRYQYVMSQMGHVMGDFTKTADTWANVTRTIGQQFQKLGQIIGQGFINAFKPALIAFRDFMNTLIELTQKAINALGKLLGWQIEFEDVGVTLDDEMEDYADALDDATGSAKKLLKTLLPIDELNVLSDTNKGGGSDVTGGGGGLSGLVSGGGMSIKPYESDVQNWFDFGTRIRDALVDGLTLNWDEIEGKVNANALRLAFLLNGLFAPNEDGEYTLGQKIGEFLGNAVNMGFQWVYMFASTFSWEDFGNTLATSLNTFIETWDAEGTGRALTSFADGILTFFTTAIEKVKWEEVGEKLMELFMGIDWGKIWTDLSNLVLAIFNAIKSAVKGAIQKAKENPQAFGEAVFNFSGIALMIGGAILSKALLANKVRQMISTMLGTSGASASAAGGATLGTLGTLALLIEAAIVWDYASGNQDERVSKFEDAFKNPNGTNREKEIAEGYAMQLGTAYSAQAANAATDMYLASSLLEKTQFVEKLRENWRTNFNLMQEDAEHSTAGVTFAINGMTSNVEKDSKSIEKFVSTTSALCSATTAEEFGSVRKSILDNLSSANNDTQVYSSLIKTTMDSSFGTARDDVMGVFGEISSTITTEMDTSTKAVKDDLADMDKNVSSFEWNFSSPRLPHLSWDPDGKEATGVLKTALETLGLNPRLPKLNVEWYAQGGYPSVGSLFVAGEAGAELVGSIGGRTGVASNGEITGIASAIYETASQTNALLRGVISAIDEKETGISQDTLFASVRSSAKSYRMRTGADAFV